jgi:hypothetical protein
VHSIERYTGNALRVAVIPGLEPAARAERTSRPRNDSNRRNNGGGWKVSPEWKSSARPTTQRRRAGN